MLALEGPGFYQETFESGKKYVHVFLSEKNGHYGLTFDCFFLVH